MPIAYLAWVLMAPSGPVVLSHAGDVYKLDAKRLDEAVSDMTFLARQARIIPNYANGKPTGFKLFGIRRGSLYGQLGLRNGDIVTHLHGHPLTSPNTALEAYEVVRNARRVELGVDRRGERLTLVYEVVGGDRVDVAPVKYDPTALPRPPPRPPEPRIEVVGRMTGALDVMMGADTADGEITLNLPKVVLRHLTGPIESFAFEKVRIKLKVERDEKATMLRFVEIGRASCRERV